MINIQIQVILNPRIRTLALSIILWCNSAWWLMLCMWLGLIFHYVSITSISMYAAVKKINRISLQNNIIQKRIHGH